MVQISFMGDVVHWPGQCSCLWTWLEKKEPNQHTITNKPTNQPRKLSTNQPQLVGDGFSAVDDVVPGTPRGAPDNCLINYSELSFPAILFPAWPIGKNGSYHALSIHQHRGHRDRDERQINKSLKSFFCAKNSQGTQWNAHLLHGTRLPPWITNHEVYFKDF